MCFSQQAFVIVCIRFYYIQISGIRKGTFQKDTTIKALVLVFSIHILYAIIRVCF
jgi:hypothetical protein